MSIQNILNMTITAQSKAITAASFGTPLIAAYHEVWTDSRVHSYTDPSELLDEGFDTDDAVYQIATAIMSQEPAPEGFKVGRRAIVNATTLDPSGHLALNTAIGEAVDDKAFAYVVTSESATNLADVCNDIVTAAQAVLPGYTVTTDGTLVTIVAPGGLIPTLAALLTEALVPTETATGDVLSCTIDGHAVSHTVLMSENGSLALVCAGLLANINSGLPAGFVAFQDGAHVYVVRADGIAPTIGSLNNVTATSTSVHNLATASVELGPPAQTIQLIPTNLSAGFRYVGSIAGKAYSYEIQDADAGNLAAVCNSFSEVLSALSLAATITANSGNVEIEVTTPGTILSYVTAAAGKRSMLKLKDVTPDTSLAADIAAIRDEDDNWYGLLLDTNNSDSIIEAAGSTEPLRKICYTQSADWDVKDGGQTGDPASLLKASSYSRTGLIYHGMIGGAEWLAAAVLGGRLANNPGKENWSFKEAEGITADILNQGEEDAIFAKNASDYTEVLDGADMLIGGGKAGDGSYFDTVRNIDALYNDLVIAVVSTQANLPKVPYTNSGVDLMCTAILDVLGRYVTNGTLAADPPPFCTGPKVLTVDPNLRKQRILPNINFGGQLAGAIEFLGPVTGLVTV